MNLIQHLNHLATNYSEGRLMEAEQLERSIKLALVNTRNPSIKMVLDTLTKEYDSAQEKADELKCLVNYLEGIWNPRNPIPYKVVK
jgi:hypothetical protein